MDGTFRGQCIAEWIFPNDTYRYPVRKESVVFHRYNFIRPYYSVLPSRVFDFLGHELSNENFSEDFIDRDHRDVSLIYDTRSDLNDIMTPMQQNRLGLDDTGFDYRAKDAEYSKDSIAEHMDKDKMNKMAVDHCLTIIDHFLLVQQTAQNSFLLDLDQCDRFVPLRRDSWLVSYYGVSVQGKPQLLIIKEYVDEEGFDGTLKVFLYK